MYEGGVESSAVEQMVGSGNPNWWCINSIMRPPSHVHSFNFSHHHLPPPLFAADLPHSCSELLLGELVDEEDMQAKKFENWEEQLVDRNNWINSSGGMDLKQEKYSAATLSNNMLRFSPISNQDPSSECNMNTTPTGGAAKRAKIQQFLPKVSTLKVRKEKLGDRITALHQLVSPFGKTDTASVLLEAIGYIKFLQNQVEALSLPYLGDIMQHHSGKRNYMLPDDPGQEQEKDLRSRGLCLVPISCTVEVGSENGADYWAPAFGTNFQ